MSGKVALTKPQEFPPDKASFPEIAPSAMAPTEEARKRPSLLGSELVKKDQNGDLIGSVVRNGRCRKVPAFSFMDTNMKALVEYLHLRSTQAASSSGDLAAVERRLIGGDVNAGKSYFTGTGQCGSCHSPSGDLQGIGSRYPPKTLERLLIYPSDVPRRAMQVTSQSRAMRSVES